MFPCLSSINSTTFLRKILPPEFPFEYLPKDYNAISSHPHLNIPPP
ncbi:hypothetical protein A2U01_0097944, partial [Trifolium medium]|nr:hypothetical protein [Trifolium medium]